MAAPMTSMRVTMAWWNVPIRSIREPGAPGFTARQKEIPKWFHKESKYIVRYIYRSTRDVKSRVLTAFHSFFRTAREQIEAVAALSGSL
jgi:hypothetical protein